MTDIKTALYDLLRDRDASLDQAVDRHFAPHYRQRTNGSWDDRAGFVAHIAHLREVVDSVDAQVLDEITDARHYADRHVVTIVKRDGSRVVQEVYLFADIEEDGRFCRVQETTLMLSGSEADRQIGSSR